MTLKEYCEMGAIVGMDDQAENAELLANWIEYIITHIEWEQHIGYKSAKAPTEIDWNAMTLQLQTLKDIVPTLNKPKGLFFAPALDALHNMASTLRTKKRRSENEKST